MNETCLDLKRFEIAMYRQSYWFCFEQEQLKNWDQAGTHFANDVHAALTNRPSFGKTVRSNIGFLVYVDASKIIRRKLHQLEAKGISDPVLVSHALQQAVLSTMAHEVAHVCLRVSERIGYNPVNEQEPFCYLTGEILSNGLAELQRWDFHKNQLFGASLLMKKHLRDRGNTK